MEQDDRRHYFIFYNGNHCKHLVAKPIEIEILTDPNYSDDIRNDYRNVYEQVQMSVRIHKQHNATITIENVSEVWSFPFSGADCNIVEPNNPKNYWSI